MDHFAALEDPRQSWKTLYPLDEILLIVLGGVMAGADDFVEISLWGRRKLDWLRRFLPLKHGVPSHDTLNDVMNALPNELFAECFTNWVASLREDDADIVAIDGKTSRRAHGADGRALHLVSAWAARQRLVLGQERCATKKMKSVLYPACWNVWSCAALVTIEVRRCAPPVRARRRTGCQHGIADTILRRGADYLLALKGNQKSLHAEVAIFFDPCHRSGLL
ncbi:MAG: ISAs1 family transposase [Cypionkella sp.]|nr:ISAs1 family transposase [Cypionkella sp.]